MQPDNSNFKILLIISEFLITGVVFAGVYLIFRNFKKRENAQRERDRNL
ncbi:MAG: hypothetical protein KJS92_08950 [Bacteroidetes bacterium]|nr:hypothetical protein [Bacteroidota bacterium]